MHAPRSFGLISIICMRVLSHLQRYCRSESWESVTTAGVMWMGSPPPRHPPPQQHGSGLDYDGLRRFSVSKLHHCVRDGREDELDG